MSILMNCPYVGIIIKLYIIYPLHFFETRYNIKILFSIYNNYKYYINANINIFSFK